LRATFARRRTSIPETVPLGLSDEFANDQDKIRQWNAFRKRIAHEETGSLMEVVQTVRNRAIALFLAARDLPSLPAQNNGL